MLNVPPRVIIKNCFSIVKDKDGDYLLADVRRDKFSGDVYYSTRAIYQNALNLISDVTALLMKRAVYLKTISNQDELLKEMAAVALSCRDAIHKIENTEGK